MDDIKRALLGDHEAAKRLTEKGVLLRCPMCGSNPELFFWYKEEKQINPSLVRCIKCGLHTSTYLRIKDAILVWNTRAPILSAEEMEMLDENRPD